MKPASAGPAAFFCLAGLFAFPAVAGELSERVAEGTGKIRSRLAFLRATPEDCANPTRWELPLTIPAVEDFLARPFTAPGTLAAWTEAVAESASRSELYSLAETILASEAWGEEESPPAVSTSAATWRKELPDNPALLNLIAALRAAAPVLRRSYESLTPGERNAILALSDFPTDEVFPESTSSPRFKGRAYAAMRRFDQDSLLRAGRKVLNAVPEPIDALLELAGEKLASDPLRVATDVGDVLIAGAGDHHYSSSTLENVALLIDLGGKNTYEGAVAGAGPGQIRVAIDFGDDVTVVSTHAPVSCGGGVFGIGLFFLPNPNGTKTIVSGNFSQGAGLCGVGGFFAHARGRFQGDRYVQGMGAFGAGIFSNRGGQESTYQAHLYGQGAGFTRGLGVFFHKGTGAALRAGLVDPDPREPLGTTSLCQGIGYGPRAYAGGGVGLCVLKGDRISAEGSYFAQGAGYWHAAGALYLKGDGNSAKARRYDQGSGIHSAVGALFVKGNRNHLMNWGVGPAFGWDSGFGWAYVLGDENKVQAEWGTATASINASRSFSFFAGNNNRLNLPGMGTAHYTRDLADYAVSWIEGDGTRVQAPLVKKDLTVRHSFFTSPWGLVELDGVDLTPDVGLEKVQWASLPRGEAVTRAEVNLAEEIEKSQALPAEEKVRRLVQVASAFSVDKHNPRLALARLVALPDADVAHLVRAVDPRDFDGYVQVRTAIGILGEAAAQAILSELETESGERRAWFLTLLSFIRGRSALAPLLAGLDDPDWRIQAVCMRVLGTIWNEDPGMQPGRMLALRSLRDWLKERSPGPQATEGLARRLAGRTFAESAAVLAFCGRSSAPDRLRFLEQAPEDISSNLSDEQARALLGFVAEKRAEALANVAREVEESESLREKVRQKLVAKLAGGAGLRKETLNAAVTALGNLGDARDAEKIAPFLDHASSLVRESAAAALGRIGRPALPLLEAAARSGDPRARAQAVNAAGRSVDGKFLRLIEDRLQDDNPTVRKAAMSLVPHLQPAVASAKEKLEKRIRKLRVEPQSTVWHQRLLLFGEKD